MNIEAEPGTDLSHIFNQENSSSYPAVFIRAPAILKVSTYITKLTLLLLLLYLQRKKKYKKASN
jgi:glutamine amidotransferase PdxT